MPHETVTFHGETFTVIVANVAAPMLMAPMPDGTALGRWIALPHRITDEARREGLARVGREIVVGEPGAPPIPFWL